jgi:hypothetical protein
MQMWLQRFPLLPEGRLRQTARQREQGYKSTTEVTPLQWWCKSRYHILRPPVSDLLSLKGGEKTWVTSVALRTGE